MNKRAIYVAFLASLAITVLLVMQLRGRGLFSNQESTPQFTVVEYDGCEYIHSARDGLYNSNAVLAHKGNCKYCAARLREMLNK